MERFSNTTREVAQNGRRGALMITMDIAHPDIEKFVLMKQDLSKVTGANVSVRLSDEFMQAVTEDKEYEHRWPIESAHPQITKKIKAKQLWETIITCAYKSAEPGLIFWDRQHKYSTSSVYPEFKNVSTNPCSEIAMQGGDSCRLIAMNLYSFVKNPFTPEASFDYKKLYEVTYESQRLMDDLVDLELETIERIITKVQSDKEPTEIKQVELDTWKLLYDAGKKGRRTGLGFTALADAMAALNMKFDSPEAIKEIDKIMKTKCEAEFTSSIDLAIERGSFEGFDKKVEDTSEYIQMLKNEMPEVYDRMMANGRRNISISTVAPTGSLSILAQTSSGLEPVYQTSYKRRRKINPNDRNASVDYVDKMGDKWEMFDVYHPKLKEWMQATGETDVTKSPYNGSTANEIDWIKRVELQSLVQKYTTHSISSTINLPKDVPVGKVGEIYIEAWKHGLKGITVYRDGSRDGVLVTNEESSTISNNKFLDTNAPKRPQELVADVIRFSNGTEKWLAFVGILNGKPYEIFTGKAEDAFTLPNWVQKGYVIKNKNGNGKKRYDFRYEDKEGYDVIITGLSRMFNKEYWNYARLISGVLRHGMPIPSVVDLISNLNVEDVSINTWKAGVERALKKYIPSGTKSKDKQCPNCQQDTLIYEEGCLKCSSCGLTKCG
jgi:ribonucleoside-diphosphate reductase alpha chain